MANLGIIHELTRLAAPFKEGSLGIDLFRRLASGADFELISGNKSTFSGKPSAALSDLLVVISAVSILTLALILVVYLWWKSRRNRRRRHHHRQDAHRVEKKVEAHLAEDDEFDEEEESEEQVPGRRKRRRRRRRRGHRPRNPTLAETGGLPPVRSTDAPPPPI